MATVHNKLRTFGHSKRDLMSIYCNLHNYKNFDQINIMSFHEGMSVPLVQY